jgi:hypothetical protein
VKYKAYRYVQDLDVEDEFDGVRLAAEKQLPAGEYFVFPLGDGVNALVNGAVVQVNDDGTARLLRTS